MEPIIRATLIVTPDGGVLSVEEFGGRKVVNTLDRTLTCEEVAPIREALEQVVRVRR